VQTDQGPVRRWSQPIINQPEIGVLGIIVKEFDGILHCLMQAKMEPGNRNGVQLSPTVQATRSNYTLVHRGKPVPYLDYFLRADARRVLADVLQSEQGAWFYQKQNRNIIVEVTEDVELLDGFCWLTIGQLHRLLAFDDLVNMDSRTVLSCLPFSGIGPSTDRPSRADQFQAGLIESVSGEGGALYSTAQIRSWVTGARARLGVNVTLAGLAGTEHWQRSVDRISHASGLFFDVMAVAVRAGNREVAGWTQPMIESRHHGVVAFVVTRIGGVAHALVGVRVEPGCLNVMELAPTVQCTPENYAGENDAGLPASTRPPYLDLVLDAPPDRVRFDAMLSEEGGRFYHISNRYLIVEIHEDDALALGQPADDFRWLTLHQLADLMKHSHYLNVQARSLTACLYSLMYEREGAEP
jgi:oxidase EvaA